MSPLPERAERVAGTSHMHAPAVMALVAALCVAACHRSPEPGGDRSAARAAPHAPSTAPTPAPDPAPPTGSAATAFTERFLAYVRRTHPAAQVRASGDLEVTIEGGTALPLANLTAECSGDGAGAQCERAMERWTRVLLDTTHAPAPATRENVRAALFPAAVVLAERARAQRDNPGAPMPFVGRSWVGPLWLAYVIDSPDTIATMTSVSQNELGLDEHALHELALDNMRRAFPQDVHGEPFAETTPGLHVLRPPDSYGAARLILHERWAPIAREVSGDLLAAGPARDTALYTGSASERDVHALRWLAQQMFQHEPHPMSPAVLKWTPRGWVLFDENATPVGPPPTQ